MNIEKKFTRDATNETPNFIEIFKSRETNQVGYRNKDGILVPFTGGSSISDATIITNSIISNGFRIVGCINEDIILPDNTNLEYKAPLSMCAGHTLTIPVGTTLTIID